MKNQKHHRWTNEELKTLMRLWSEDVPLDDLARQLKTTRYAVGKMVVKLRKEGIPLKRRTKGNRAENASRPWTQAEAEYLVRRRKEYATAEEIATDLGRSYLAVQGMIQKLRGEGVRVQMLGMGVRRFWDTASLMQFNEEGTA